VDLQLQYSIPAHSFTNLHENSNFCYKSDQQFAAKEMPSDQGSHTPYNQAKKFQNNTLNCASQFPHILSALRGDYTIGTGVSVNPEYVYAGGDSSVAETTSANIYWSQNQTQPSFSQPQYEPISPPMPSDNADDKTYTFPLDANFNELQHSSCGLHSQTEKHMSALTTLSAEPVTDQGVSYFLEMPVMEPLYQAALKISQNENHISAEKLQMCTDVTTQISLFDLQDPLEELFPLSLRIV
jgi:hypothetical protein